jgi:molybdopterin-guanine dinucleotide biosynthesis protein A
MTGRTLGAIFAGGASSRFGSDKAEALWQGKALIDHVIARLRPQVDALVLLGGAGRGDLATLPDRPGPGLGPLGGLNASLHAAHHDGFEWVLTAPCDSPLLPSDYHALLRTTVLQQDCWATFVVSGERRHPAFGLWRTALADTLDAYLTNANQPSDRAVHRFASTVGAVPTRVDDPAGFANINHPDDLAALPYSAA